MPPKDGLRLDDAGGAEQAGPQAGHPHQQQPVAGVQTKARRRSTQGDIELMSEKQVLGFKPVPRLEQVDEKHCERAQDPNHLPQSCNDSLSRCEPRRMEFSESTRRRRPQGGMPALSSPSATRSR